MTNRAWAGIILLIGIVFFIGLVLAGMSTDNDNVIPPLNEWPTTSVPGEGVFPDAPTE